MKDLVEILLVILIVSIIIYIAELKIALKVITMYLGKINRIPSEEEIKECIHEMLERRR